MIKILQFHAQQQNAYRSTTAFLNALTLKKWERANSKQIADAIGIDSATVRRDFSYFGELGETGFGYDVKNWWTSLPIS